MSEMNGKNKPGNMTSEASPTLIEMVVQAESPELRQLRKKVEEGSDHPSDELLRAYAFHHAAPEDARSIMEHVALCGACARKAFSLTLKNDELIEDLGAATSEISWLDRLKSFVSNLSFPIMIQSPALEAVRGPEDKDAVPVMKVGDHLWLYVRIPAEGHIAVFHYVEQSDEVKLIFPDCPSEITKFPAGQNVFILEGDVERPVGLQTLKVIWTKDSLIDTGMIVQENETDTLSLMERYFDELENLEEGAWMETVYLYKVED